MKLEHMQALLDDFCIPLQLATGSTQEHDPDSKDKVSRLTEYRLENSSLHTIFGDIKF